LSYYAASRIEAPKCCKPIFDSTLFVTLLAKLRPILDLGSGAMVAKTRFEISVELQHVGHISNCLSGVDCEDFTVSPIISGWGVKGYWSSEHSFSTIGKRVAVRFTVDPNQIKPLLETGFGILAMDITPICQIKTPHSELRSV
jgi:hypothetical protein